jgi:hypothetical protein
LVQRDALVPVGAAELVVALDGEHGDAPVGELDDGGVEGAGARPWAVCQRARGQPGEHLGAAVLPDAGGCGRR